MFKIFRFLSRYKWQSALLIILIIGKTVGTLIIPTLTADILNGITSQPPQDMSYVWQKGGIMLAVAASTAIISILSTYLSTYIATGMGRDIRGALYRKAQAFSVNDFNKFGAASLITRSTSDVTQIQLSFSIIVEMLLPAPFMTIAALVLAFRKSGNMSFMLVGFMAAIVIVLIIVAVKVVPIFEKMQTSLDNINRKVRDNIIGVRVIRAFNRESDEKKRTDQTFQKYANISIKANKIFAVMTPIIMLLMYGCAVLIIWIGGGKVVNGTMGMGDISAIIEYSMLTLMYLMMGVATFMFIPRAQTCAKRVNAVLETNPEFTEVKASDGKGNAETSVKAAFHHVGFRYPGAEEYVLQDIDFSVEKGKTTAIIGSTGSGKSTIANLLMRLYDVSEGSISVDGKDVREYTVEALRDKIGYVPQKAFLFSGTIADNLRHGKKDATEEEMRHAAEIAQIADFIEEKEQGFLYPVAQGGTNFSGGQKQRLSIARAIIKKPDIYIFDDSFSALDFKTDAKLRAALKKEVGESAVIIVAQRISSIQDADQILVLDEGRLVGKGKHDKLMKDCEVYSADRVLAAQRGGIGIMAENEIIEREESPDLFGDDGMSAARAKQSKITMKRFARELSKQKGAITLVLFCLAITAACALAAPYFIGKAITVITNGAITNYLTANPELILAYPELVPPDYVPGAVFTIGFANLGKIILLVFCLYLAAALMNYISQYTLASVSQKISLDMRKRISNKLNKLPLKFYDTHKKGDILSRVTSDTDKVADTLQETLAQMFTSVLTIAGAFVAMFVISWQLALIALASVFCSTLAAALISMRTQRHYAANQKALGALNANIEESFTGNNIIRAFNLQNEMIQTNDALNENMRKVSTKAQFITYAINPVIRLMGQIGYVFIAAFGAMLVLRNALEVGVIISVFMYIDQVSEPVTELAYTLNTLQGAIASAERIYEIEDELEEVPDVTDAILLPAPQGEVIFDHVRFGYSDDKILMEDIDIDVAPGSKIAVVGPTGAGKTTLVNLLMRFYELQGGNISIDGVNIAEMSRKELRSTLGMVLQDTWLFNGTIAENIAYGKRDATDEEVRAAAKAARIDRFIRTLPEGYDTVLDDEVMGISAGQKQLLTIARAILADPAILILDEATSSVDTRTEIEIQKAMNNLMQGRTSFVIAHRLSTIKDADKILVMREGTIVEQGAHEKLLAENGFYAELYNSQFAAKSC